MNENNNMIGSLTDQLPEKDLLGITTYVDTCAKFIMECDTPMTIAVLGGWGTGKSSFMELVKNKLKEKENSEKEAVIIDFNTWQFSRAGENRLLIPLLTQLKRIIDEKSSGVDGYNDFFIEGGKNDLKPNSFWRYVGDTGVNTGQAVGGIWGGGITFIGNVVKHWNDRGKSENEESETEEASKPDPYTEILEMRENLQKRIDVLVGKKEIKDKDNDKNQNNNINETKTLVDKGEPTKRLVVFVDDLDRLAPIEAVSLLEDMKNFTDCTDIVFVLALDQSLVKRGVFEKYRNTDDNTIDDSYAVKFFEKIVQIPFYLPTGRYDVKNYVSTLLQKIKINDLNPDKCVRSIRKYTDGNPRLIKRALNLYQLNASIFSSANTSGNPDGLFALILLQMCHEDIFTNLCEDLSQIYEKYNIISLFEKIEKLDDIRQDEFLSTAMYPEKYAYLLELYTDFPKLYDAVMSSTFSEKGSELSKEQQLGEIYQLLRDYLAKKGCKRKYDAKGNEIFESQSTNKQVFQVRLFENIVNINFIDVKDQKRKKCIDQLLYDGVIKPANSEKEHIFKKSRKTYIKDDKELFIHNVTNNPEVLTTIGKIVCDLLKETEEAEETVETEPANKSAE